MTSELPEPKSRKESYLAKAAGMDVTIPEAPESRLEQYLEAIAEGGGGGGTSDFNELTNRPKYNGTAMTGETNIPVAPTIVQTTGNSQTDVMSQDATTKMVFKNGDTKAVCIGSGATTKDTQYQGIAIGQNANSSGERFGTAIGASAAASGRFSIAIGSNAKALQTHAVAVGEQSNASDQSAVAIGYGATAPTQGQFDISTGTNVTSGYNNSNYRLLTGLYDGQSAHDAATVGQALGTTESYMIASGSWSALSSSDPYTFQATVTATHTISASTVAELLNDAPVTFATYGFAIGSISGQSVTIYSIGQPSASVTLKVNYKG